MKYNIRKTYSCHNSRPPWQQTLLRRRCFFENIQFRFAGSSCKAVLLYDNDVAVAVLSHLVLLLLLLILEQWRSEPSLGRFGW